MASEGGDGTWWMPAESAQFICEHMSEVKLMHEPLMQLAQFLTNGEYNIVKWKSDNPLHPQEMTTNSAEWIFVVDSLNFSFWPDSGCEFTIKGEVGYWALCAAINRALYESVPITDSNFYNQLTVDQAKNIFRTDQANVVIPMLSERVAVLQQNGQALLQHFGGSFSNCVRKANGSAVALLRLIYEHFPSFRDEAIYKGKRVTFLKRAQILVADLWACFEGKGLGQFDDIDKLTMFADYRIPQVLHYFGVLSYSDQLLDRLGHDQLLENGSELEIEIRGASIHAVELLKVKLASIAKANIVGTLPNSIQIDFYLWGYRRKHSVEIDQKSPYHKVRSIFY